MSKNIKYQKHRGFTLMEIILSVAVIGILAAISFPLFSGFKVTSDLQTGADGIAQNLSRAQAMSQAVAEDSSWGLKLLAGQAIVFKGASYATRDVNFDEVSSLPDTLTFSGVTEIVFAKFSGETQNVGTTTLSVPTGGTKNLIINKKGVVDY
jgi:prepilin-type N-terminal cleavage/methylation domain-containing protein